jgi:hypothetical protein
MCRKRLVTCISRALMTGGLLLSLSSPLLANSYYNTWQSGYSSPSNYGKYRFRPLEKSSNSKYSYASGSYQQPSWYSGPYRMVKNNRYAFNQRNFYYGSNPNFANSTNGWQQPAFIKQYGWTPAKKMVVRRVSTSNHFASSTNTYVEEASSTAPVYRSAPINTQGFRYRDMTRNAPYVTFSDRVKQFTKMKERFVTQQPQIQHVQVQPVEQRHERSVFKVKPQNAGRVGNYNFRPDQRFTLLPQAPRIEAEHHPKQGGFQLVDAKVQETSNNFLDNWSFRPVESTF